MRIALSLVILLVLAWVVGYLGSNWSEMPPVGAQTALSVGLLMVGAWRSGELLSKIGLPKVSGYLLFGVFVGPYVAGLVPFEQVSAPADEEPPLQFANNLAIALIALTAGGEIRLGWLKQQITKVAAITGAIVIVVWILLGSVVFVAEQMIPVISEQSFELRLVMAMLVGLVAAANSPAVVMAVLSETRSRGPLSQMTLAVTIFKDMVMVLLFAAALSIGKGLAAEETALSGAFVWAVLIQLLGSLLLGAGIGAVMAFYVKQIGEHLIIFVVGLCLLIALIGEQHFAVAGKDTHLEPLLIALAAGMMMQNLWPKISEPLFETVESMSLPVYCLFFAVAGAKVDLGILGQLWLVVLVLAIFRAAAIWGSVTLASRVAGLDPAWRNLLWMGFLPQAGIALALAMIIEKSLAYPGVSEMGNVLIGVIAVNELIGPIGFRWALQSSGEAASGAPESATDSNPSPATD